MEVKEKQDETSRARLWGGGKKHKANANLKFQQAKYVKTETLQHENN